MGRIKYRFDGIDISETYNITIAKVDGIFDIPKRKIPYRHSWDDVSGEEVDLSNVNYEPRQIVIEGFVRGENISAAWINLSDFVKLIDKAGPRQFTIDYDQDATPAKGLTYLVFREDQLKVTKRFRPGLKNVWEFTLKLQEYMPFKSIYRFVNAGPVDLSIQITALSRPILVGCDDGRITKITEINTHMFDFDAGSFVVGIFSASPDDFTVGTINADFVWKM